MPTKEEVKEEWDRLSKMSMEELESLLDINPETGKPDGLYTLQNMVDKQKSPGVH